MLYINLKKLRSDAILPTKAYPEDAGYDLYTPDELIFMPGERKLIKLGFALQLPSGWYGQMKTKSGLASKGFSVTAGVMDSNYRGEYSVFLDWEPWKMSPLPTDFDLLHKGIEPIARFDDCVGVNKLNYEPYVFKSGDKIAQVVFLPVPPTVITEVQELDETDRGKGGFGSTGF